MNRENILEFENVRRNISNKLLELKFFFIAMKICNEKHHDPIAVEVVLILVLLFVRKMSRLFLSCIFCINLHFQINEIN